MKYENVRLTEAVRRIRMIFVVGVIAACVLCGGKIPAFAEDTQEQYDSSQSSYGQLLEQEGDTSGILQFGGQLEYEDADEEDGEASLAAASTVKYEKAIISALNKFSPRLNVKNWGLTTKNVAGIVTKIMNAHPEVVYVAKYSYLYDGGSGKVMYLKFTYKPNARTEKKQLESAIAAVNSQIKTKGMKPEEIVLAYHEYLTSTVAYDTSGLKGYSQTTGRDHMYDMYGTLVKRSAVCQGYAETMWYFLKKAGVPCGLATSKYLNHAWNVVSVGGNWYHVDATWDDPASDIPGQSMHNFFMVSTSTLNARTKAMSAKYPKGRYDAKIGNIWKGVYKKAASRTYEKGRFWNGVKKTICYRGGYWYTIKQGSKPEYYQISRYSFKSNKNQTIFVGDAVWKSTDGTTLSGQYGSIFVAQELLYFCTDRYIARIDLTASDVTASIIYDARNQYVDGVNIYAIGYQGSEVVVWLSDTPTCSRKDAYRLGACMKHSWKKGEVTKKPTYASTGTQIYICKNCKYQKTVTLSKLKLKTIKPKTQNTQAGVKLTWTRDSGATGYRIYRKTANGSYRQIKIVGAAAAAFTDKSCVSGNTYTYRISAYNSYTKGGSTAVNQYYIGCAKTRCSKVSGGVKLSWNRVKGAGGYKVYRKAGNGKYKCIKTLSSGAASYTDKGVKKGTKYTYFVKPYKNSVAGSYTKAEIVYK